MRLTIGYPTYDDYAGMELSLQPLLMYHDLADVELVIVDNHPDGADAARLRHYARQCGARYVPLADPVGTAAPRDKIFEVASGDVVIVMDGHVVPAPHMLSAVREYFAQPEHARDILSGPLLGSGRGPDGRPPIAATHYADEWRGGMWGTWQNAWRCSCGEAWHFDVRAADTPDTPDTPWNQRRVEYRRVAMRGEIATECPGCGRRLPEATTAECAARLTAAGFVRRCRTDIDVEPFEIPGMGLGMCAMRRDAWPGFAPGMRGFGGGELHLHELVRRNGGRAVCHPLAGWWHRWDRPRAPYPLRWWDIARNYVLWRRRLEMSLNDVHAAFVASDDGSLSEAQWRWLLKDPVGRIAPPDPSVAAPRPPRAMTNGGPGSELHALLAECGITPGARCDCERRMRQMDVWGVAGCRDRRTEIAGWLREGSPRWGWVERLRAAALAVASGVAWRLSPTDPYGSLVDEAIRRAERGK